MNTTISPITNDDFYPSDEMNVRQLLQVHFQKRPLFLVDVNNEPYVTMRHVVENIGLDWKSQYTKLMGMEDRFCVQDITTQVMGDDQSRKMIAMPLRKLFGWLMTINPNKVSPELKDTVVAYQTHCDEVLNSYWMGKTTGRLDHLINENQQLKEGLYAAHVNWEMILEGKRQGMTHQQICNLTGYKATSTIYRNLKKMLGYGLMPEDYQPGFIAAKIDKPTSQET